MREALEPRAREQVHAAFEELSGRALAGAFTENAGLFEAFRVWILDAEAVREQTSATLDELARKSDEWHYQVYRMDSEGHGLEGSPGHVRCARDPSRDNMLTPIGSVPESHLARNLRVALPQIEERYPRELAVARLLEVPEFSLHVLWISEGPGASQAFERILVVHAPDIFSDLPEGELMEAGEFLIRLRDQQPVVGFVLREGPTEDNFGLIRRSNLRRRGDSPSGSSSTMRPSTARTKLKHLYPKL